VPDYTVNLPKLEAFMGKKYLAPVIPVKAGIYDK
jgi:hypothetical protein